MRTGKLLMSERDPCLVSNANSFCTTNIYLNAVVKVNFNY